jgi:hypothetical protein
VTNPDSFKKKRKEAMIKALEKTLGVVSSACKIVGISRETHYQWMKQDGQYKKEVEFCADLVLDFAETALHKNIKEGREISTIFFLKTKGKNRGYIEKQDIDMNHSHTGPATIIFTDNSKKNEQED